MNNKEEIKKDKEELYQVCLRLIAFPEWIRFVKEMELQAQEHEKAGIEFLDQNKLVDAQRQAWLMKGILETMERPNFIIAEHDSNLEKIKRNFLSPLLQKILDKK